MTTYAVLNAEGECINRVIWDGETPWTPPDGCIAVADPDNLHPIKVVDVPSESADPLASLTDQQKQALIALLQAS